MSGPGGLTSKHYKWRTGRPPQEGWYRASRYKKGDSWRWWNGTVWSISITRHATQSHAADVATIPAPDQNNILWAI